MSNSILDQLSEPSGTGWRPKPGDVLVGTVLRISEGVSTYNDGSVYPIVAVKTEGGEVVNIHCFHTVLKSEMAKARPARGDRIGVRYEGKPDGRSYEMYKVAVEKPDGKPQGEPDWDQVAKAAETELEGPGGYTDEESF
jgi:hypothetical protein